MPDEIVEAMEKGGEVTITANEVSVSYEPGMLLGVNLLSFEDFMVA